MSMEDVLREKEEQLAELYEANLGVVRSLQRTLRQDIVPGLVDELHLEEEEERRATSWLNDLRASRLSLWLIRPSNMRSDRTESIFRLLRVCAK